MVQFHHASRGRNIVDIDTAEPIRQLTRPMFFTRDANEIEFKMMMAAGMQDYGGYTHYTMNIPETEFTESLHPTTKKVLRITKSVLKKLASAFGMTIQQCNVRDRGRGPVSRRMIIDVLGENVIGIDATLVSCFGAFDHEMILFELPDGIVVIPISQTVCKYPDGYEY